MGRGERGAGARRAAGRARCDAVTSVAWSLGGTTIASEIKVKTVRVWDAVTREPALGGLLEGHGVMR